MASDDVLDRERVESATAWMTYTGGDFRPREAAKHRREILAHDAALRARIEELEATVREELCKCGPTDNPDLDEHADYCRARRALNDTEEGGDGSL